MPCFLYIHSPSVPWASHRSVPTGPHHWRSEVPRRAQGTPAVPVRRTRAPARPRARLRCRTTSSPGIQTSMVGKSATHTRHTWTHVDTRGHGMAFHSRWVACMAFLIISALHWVSRMSLVPFWSSFLRARGAQAYTVSMNEGHYGHWSTEQPGMLVKGGCKP